VVSPHLQDLAQQIGDGAEQQLPGSSTHSKPGPISGYRPSKNGTVYQASKIIGEKPSKKGLWYHVLWEVRIDCAGPVLLCDM
jgi:hypothetical protein